MKGHTRLLAVPVLVSLLADSSYAHSMYQSAVMLDFSGRETEAELQLPLERVQAALGRDTGAPVANYVLSHFGARDSAGHPFTVRLVGAISIKEVDDAPYVVCKLSLSAPGRQTPEVFDVEDDVFADRLPGQVALISIRSDWQNGVFANDPQLIGVIRGNARSVTVDRSGGNWFKGFGSVFRLGVRHIAEGTDHLLFLLTLLLPAPLLVRGARWSEAAGMRQSLLRIVKVVSSFTVGHSITLACAALGVVHVPSRPVEVLIAGSILVSSIHALRPIFPGREAAIAASFGLIHGLAFASTLSELGLGRWERVASILAFNLGIEGMQLVVVVATMPALMLLSRGKAYSFLRVCGALFAGLASLGWIVERLFDKHTGVDSVVDGIANEAGWIAGALFLVSVIFWWFSELSHFGGSPIGNRLNGE